MTIDSKTILTLGLVVGLVDAINEILKLTEGLNSYTAFEWCVTIAVILSGALWFFMSKD